MKLDTYVERIKKQINKETNLDNLSKDMLSKSDKNNLIQELKVFNTGDIDIQSSIERLKLSTSHID